MTPPDDCVLPCGCSLHCTVVDGINTVTVLTCSEDCPTWLELAREADQRGIPRHTIHIG